MNAPDENGPCRWTLAISPTQTVRCSLPDGHDPPHAGPHPDGNAVVEFTGGSQPKRATRILVSQMAAAATIATLAGLLAPPEKSGPSPEEEEEDRAFREAQRLLDRPQRWVGRYGHRSRRPYDPTKPAPSYGCPKCKRTDGQHNSRCAFHPKEPGTCRTCGKRPATQEGRDWTPEEKAQIDGYHASFRGPNGEQIFHTGHLRPELMELPRHWYCKRHMPGGQPR